MNSSFINNSAGGGGAIATNAVNLSVFESSFINNSAGVGGAIRYDGANFKLVNSTFSGNYANSSGTAEGGAIYNSAVNFSVVNSSFINNSAGGSGGAIHNYGINFSVVNSSFKNNFINSSWWGAAGAIYNGANGASVLNSIFSDNFANAYSGYGGAIYNGGRDFSVLNSSFNNNFANASEYARGGAIYTAGHNFSVLNSSFNDNSVNGSGSGSGGAIHNDGLNGGGRDFSVMNSIFMSNLANVGSAQGGAIYNGGNGFILINSSFKNNFINSSDNVFGGAISNGANNFSVENSSFSGNFLNITGYGVGGAIYNGGGNGVNNFSVVNSSFNGNFLNGNSGSGGAISTGATNFSVVNSTFMDNFINATNNVYGGAISTGNGGNVLNSIFKNNSANGSDSVQGGAIRNTGINFSVINSTFNDNFANGYNSVLGGAIVHGGGNFSVMNVSFNGNFANGFSNVYGGAIYDSVIYNHITADKVVNSSFNDNFANGSTNVYGGAIYIQSNNFSVLNSSFNNNPANNSNSDGGAIYIVGNYFNILNSNLTGNKIAIIIASAYANITGNNIIGNDMGINLIDYRANNAYINFNRFVNNSLSQSFDGTNPYVVIEDVASGDNDLSSNWWGQNNITDLIKGRTDKYTMDDYFVLLVSYNNSLITYINTTKTQKLGSYILYYYFGLNTSRYGDVENETIDLLPAFLVNLTLSNDDSFFTCTHSNSSYETMAIELTKDNNPIWIKTIGDNEDLILRLNVPKFTNGLYVNSSWANTEGFGNSWDSPFQNINDALQAIIGYGLNVSNCNFTIHIAGNLSADDYIGEGVNVNLDLNSFYDNLTIRGEYGHAVFDGESKYRIFGISASNMSLENIIFKNGKAVDYGSAIYIYGTNNKVMNSTFNNNSATSSGGAIYITNGGNFSISDSIFNNNSATNGGAIYNHDGNISINGSIFNSNSAKSGGVIYNNGGNGFNVVNSSFSSNFVNGDASWVHGGVIYNSGNGFNVTNSSFSGNFLNASSYGSGGVIYNSGNGFNVVNSSFSGNYVNASTYGYGGAISNSGSGFSVMTSIFNGNFVNGNGQGGAISNSVNGNINYNLFVNNYASNAKAIHGSSSSVNLNSNWFGSNNITGMIGGSGYILDDYFVLLLNYSPNGNNAMINSSVNESKGGYVLSFYLALNTSNSTSMFNETAHLLPEFDKTIIVFNMTDNNSYSINNGGFSSDPLHISYTGNKLIAIQALADNENIKLLVNAPDYINGLYVNGSWSGSKGDGSSWNSPFVNLNDALQAIIFNELNSSNCNFTIHVAGNLSSDDYTGDGVNVNLDLNSKYDNLTICGEYGHAVFDGESKYRIFAISGNNISLENIVFNNGKTTDNGGAIYNNGNNNKIINSNFNNNSANWNGGVIYNSGNDFSISGSNFNNNTANYGGAIYNTYNNGFKVVDSNFNNNTANSMGGAIENYVGNSFTINGSSFTDNTANIRGGAIDNDGGSNVNINYNRFVNNSASEGKAIYIDYGPNVNLSSNWFGSNNINNINGMIYGDTYILDDYFVLLLNYSPNGNNTMINSSVNESKGNYVLSFYLALNTSNSNRIFNDTAYLVPEFNKTIIVFNMTDNNSYSINGSGFSSDPIYISYTGNKLIAIQALADNENIKLLVNAPDYTNGLYVNGSWSGFDGDGSSWNSPFVNLNDALQAIIVNELNSSNCNFTIYIAGNLSSDDYIGNGVNVNLNLNGSYTNLTIRGEYGHAVFDGKNQDRIFTISGNNISLENIEFKNGKTSDYGGAIYNGGNNNKIMNSNFNNNSVSYYGGAIYNSGSNISITVSNFINNSASMSGGAIYNSAGANFSITVSNFINNSAKYNGGAIYINGGNGNITYNRFVNNSANYGGKAIYSVSDDNVNLSSNWFGSNNIAGMISGLKYILDDYFVLLLNYSPNSHNIIVNSSVNESKGDYILSFYLALNTSNSTNMFNETAYLVPEFDKTIIIFNMTANNSYSISGGGFSSDPLHISYTGNKLIAIQALADNENIKLLVNAPDYINGLYVNGSWSGSKGDGSSWNSPFVNLNDALQAIIVNELNSSNCNFTIHVAGNLSSKNYTGNKVNVNLDLNSKYDNLTICGEYGYAVLDGEGQEGIFTISGSNISLKNIVFINGKNNYGGAIYNYYGNNNKVMNSIFINNFANERGGAIYNNGYNFSINGSNFNNNFANDRGGAIANWGGNDFSINDSNFTDNSAKYDGGAIYTDGGDNVSIMNSSFVNNVAGRYGGAISNIDNTAFSIMNSNFTDNSANTRGGAIYNYRSTGFNVSNSSFMDNNASSGGVIWTSGNNIRILSSNIYDNYNGINITNANNVIINFNRFVNNTNTIVGANSDDNLSSNWWGQNTNIGAFINNGAAGDYTLEDYFVLYLKYSPNGLGNITNSSYNASKDDYILSFYLALNTSTYDNILNDAAILLPIFDKNITINNGTENTTYDLNSNTTFSNEAIPLHYNNQLIAIQAIVDNEDLKLKLLFAKSNYTNGLYVNSSWSDSNEDGSSWNSPFQNLNAALKAIIDNKLNSTNCNFTIHIAGNLSSDDYTGDGVNVNLDLNSSYSNLTIIGEYGNAIFNGESQSRIFTISGNNISLENIVFKNGKDNYGGAIYNTGNNTKVMNSIFNNNSVSYYGGAIENYGHNFSISDSNFNDNSASSSGAISNSGHNFSISGSNFTDNFANYGYGGAISNIGGHNVSISGSNFNDNSATGSGGAIYNSGGNGFNITDSNFNSNLANIGGAIYIGYYSMGLIRNVTIISNNFVNNTNTTIFANNINNIQINHNRIYDMDKNHIAVNMTNDTIMDDVNWDLDYNWWGNNTPDTNYNGLNNYFVVNVIKNNLTNYLYTIRLNGSDNDSEFENKLPSFNGAIYLDYGDGNDVFDSNFNGNNSQQLNITIAQIAIFTVDDWTSEISNNIVINVNNLSGSKYGEIVILNASINAFDGNNTGIEVIFYINGEIIGSNMTDNLGNAYYHYKVPFIGNFIYNLSNNDSNHISTNSSEIYGEFIKSNSNITINSNLNGSKYGDTLILNTTLLDEFNNPLDGFNINFYIDNVFIGSNVTDSNGIAIFDYVVNFTGDYNFTVIFNGNDNYNGNNSSVFGDFAKADSNIIINSNINGSKYGDNLILNATVLDKYGNLLNSVNVEFYVDGVFIGSNVTDSNGIAIYNYVVGFVGNYNLTVCFNGTDNYNGYNVSVFGDFIKVDSNININFNPNGSKYGDNVILNATLFDEYGNCLNGGIVDFYINGEFIGSNVTDSNGIAIFDYVVNFTGDYNLTVVFIGNNNYNNRSVFVFGDFAKVDSNININFNPNGSKYNDNVIFNATLFDEYGNCLNGVSVEFYVDGVFIGSNVTDSNGIAIYNYVIGFVGNYNLTVVFNGNENYNYALDSVFGEFVKADGIINIDNIPKNMDINSKITIKGNLTDKDGNLLNGKYNLKINVTIGKNVYIHDVEVVNGLWSLKINNSKIGTTNVKIKLNDPNYESNKEFKYTVSKIKTIITVSAPKIIAGKKTNIVITLKDTDGKILKGKKLIIKSKYLKKPFKSTTNSKGQINIRVHASNIGKYTGTVEFAGDSIYAKSKKTITQIVTGLPDLTFSKIKRIKSSNYQLAVYTITIKNIGKGDSPKTQLYMQHWKYNGWKSKIMKVNIKAIGAGKSVNLTVKFLPDIGSHRTCKYQWFYINPLKNFKEISYKNNLKYLKP